MRRDNLFWGSALILLGGLFLLKASGLLRGDIFGWFWALFLILLGIWVLSSVYLKGQTKEEGEQFVIDLQGAKQASLKVEHGAGHIEIGAGAPSGQLLTGTKAPGMSFSSRMAGDKLEARIQAGPTFIPFIGPAGGVWHFHLNRDVPLTLKLEAGASRLSIDLSDLLVTYAKLETGASTVDLTLPARAGSALVDIEAGAASLDVHVPEGTAARICVKEGLTALNIDTNRFSRLEGNLYQSSDYEKASNRVEVNIEAGVGSVKIH
jgi:hypothetical protein